MESRDRIEFSASVARGSGGGSVITIFGELDVGASTPMDDAFERAIEVPGSVELDMRGCSFVDSTGIATLLKGARRLHDQGRVLEIKGAKERVRGILDLSGLLSQGWIVLE